eukprot:scaffold1136_cov399-Prasinococcus_capsulatus_cf.AAC.15
MFLLRDSALIAGGAYLRGEKLGWKFTAREFVGLPQLEPRSNGQDGPCEEGHLGGRESDLALDELQPHFASKLNTAVQLALVLATLGPLGYEPMGALLPCSSSELQHLLCLAASVTTAASACSYGLAFLPRIISSGRLQARRQAGRAVAAVAASKYKYLRRARLRLQA